MIGLGEGESARRREGLLCNLLRALSRRQIPPHLLNSSYGPGPVLGIVRADDKNDSCRAHTPASLTMRLPAGV